MWQRIVWLLAFGLPLSWLAEVTADELTEPGELIAHLGWVRFDVVGGRVCVTRIRVSQHRHQLAKDYDDGSCESLAVALTHGSVSVRYTLETETEKLSVAAGRGDHFEYCWRKKIPGTAAVEAEFVQPTRGPLRLTVQFSGKTKQVYHAAGFWHLVLLYPEVCNKYVVPVLERVCAESSIRTQIEQLRAELFQHIATLPCIERSTIQRLVRQLGARQYALRQQASERLRALGPGILCYLDTLDAEQLDREQRLRIEQLKMTMWRRTPDAPPRIAQWLATNKSIWVAMSDNSDPRKRQLAMHHLAELSVPSMPRQRATTTAMSPPLKTARLATGGVRR